jgi:hypothetical protein
LQYHAEAHGHWAGLNTYRLMQAAIDGLAETDGRPVLAISTAPPLNQREGEAGAGAAGARPDFQEYFAKTNRHLLTSGEFRAIDTARAAAGYPITWHSGTVHLGAQLAAVEGWEIGDNLATWRTCAVGQCMLPSRDMPAGPCGATSDCSGYNVTGTCTSGTCSAGLIGHPCTTNGQCDLTATCTFGPRASAQRYCKNNTGSWTTTPCATSAGCSTTQQCAPKPCTCSCHHTNDCVHWFGAGYSCQGSEPSKTCKKTSDSSDACDLLLSGATCQAGVCKNGAADACPASGDACHPE